MMGLTGLLASLTAGCGNSVSSTPSTSGSSTSTATGGTGGAGSTGGTGGAGGAGGAGASGGSGGGASAVTGTLRDTYLTDTGEIKDVPRASATVEAIVPQADGSFATFAGTYNADGSFVIPDVPEGEFYLLLNGGTAIVTSQRNLDLGRVLVGRPDAAKIKSATYAALDATGLSPWADGDSIELCSLGANSSGAIEKLAMSPPAIGSTSLMAFTVDLQGLTTPGLIDGSKGDKAFLTQFTTLDAGGGLTYTAAVKTAALPSFTLQTGKTTQVSGAFTDLAQKQVKVDWKRAAFAQVAAKAHPAATPQAIWLDIYGEPGGKDRVASGASPDLANLYDTTAPTDTTLDLHYGNPAPAGYAVVGLTQMGYSIPVQVAGQAQKAFGFARTSVLEDALAQGPIAPVVSPPQEVTVGGKPATSDLTGVGLAPVIAWKAPAQGTPTHYLVYLSNYKGTTSKRVATFYTTGTSVTIPLGILQSGQMYGVIIRADAYPYADKAPFRSSPVGGFADAITSLFTP
jgi:hypothetical protein